MADADPPMDDIEDPADSDSDEETGYVSDPQSLWAAEGARAMLVVLTRRLGGGFARDVHNEIYARTVAYEEGCPDDRRDAATLNFLLQAPFWDTLFAKPDPG
ncbi:hypothetical protein [uncultured Sphingomonas sp.]|uniref:hypothetical protein n=1 Tax=uncultured Sphingomonas sp. TaxID=158754 RepID=UPI0025DE6147|nr:hypothetical protein [uncultured Sphingomonas sp.]